MVTNNAATEDATKQNTGTGQLSDAEYFHIWTLMRNIAHMTGRIRDEELSQYGVTLMQSQVLYMVNALGESATPRNLARWLFREPPTISDGLARMEKQGLIKKVPLNHRGQILIILTEAGEQAYEDSTLRASIQNIMSRVSPEKCRRLKSLLLDVREAVIEYMQLAPEDIPEALPRAKRARTGATGNKMNDDFGEL
jgi:DNA-binding MarR family transcriptional regulator